LTAAAKKSVAGKPTSPNSAGRYSPGQPLSSTPLQLSPANERTVFTPSTQPTQNFSDWHDIKTILTYQKRRIRMFYKVQWQDNNYTSWIQEKDVSAVASDSYWLRRNEKANLKLEGKDVSSLDDNTFCSVYFILFPYFIQNCSSTHIFRTKFIFCFCRFKCIHILTFIRISSYMLSNDGLCYFSHGDMIFETRRNTLIFLRNLILMLWIKKNNCTDFYL